MWTIRSEWGSHVTPDQIVCASCWYVVLRKYMTPSRRQLPKLYIFDSIIMQNEVIKPTINGLLDIMKACVKAKSVRRLVFTSSAGTVNVTENQKPVFDETCWSDVDFCRRVKMTGWVSTLILFSFRIILLFQKKLSYHRDKYHI